MKFKKDNSDLKIYFVSLDTEPGFTADKYVFILTINSI